MLIQIVQTYVALPDRINDLVDALLEYEGCIAIAGYIGRRQRSLYTQPPTQRVMLTGTLQHPDAVEDLAGSRCPTLIRHNEGVRHLCDGHPVTETFEAANTHDEHYCRHQRWKEIVLVCDPILGHSTLRCNECGGIVALYKMGLSHEVNRELFRWDAQYDRLHGLWVLSTEYRDWAENELSSLDSPITQMGRSLARRITNQTEIPVLYYLHMKHEGPDRHCPSCGHSMHEAVGTIWNVSCRQCLLAVGRG